MVTALFGTRPELLIVLLMLVAGALVVGLIDLTRPTKGQH